MIQLTVLQLISIIISFFSLGFSICNLLYMIFNYEKNQNKKDIQKAD